MIKNKQNNESYISEHGEKVLFKRDNILINNSRDAYTIFAPKIARKPQEYFVVMILDGRNGLLAVKTVTIGTLDASLYHPRELFRAAIQKNGAKIIVAHNHPSGSLEPSQNDLNMTQRIKEAGDLMGIKLVDSLIISREGYRSIF